jgi:hypothetical protein
MLFNGRFFNMTRWGMDYGGPTNPPIIPAVPGTSAWVAAALGAPAVPYAAFLTANAASNDLQYIPAAVRQQVLNGANLFNRPVGSSDADNSCSGNTNLAAFRPVMQSIFPPDPAGAWRAWLSVVDSNAAHHLSLLLAERGFTTAPPPAVAGPRARVVINVDAHEDFSGGAVNIANLRCDNWGLYTVRSVGQIWPNPLATAYVTVGTSSDAAGFRNSKVRLCPPAAVNARGLPGDTAAAQVQALWAELQAAAPVLLNNPAGAWAGCDVYLSVDRDVEQFSFTDYNDGSYAPAVLWPFVAGYVAAFAANGINTRFVGFDICGLPTWGGMSRVRPIPPPVDRRAQAVADITRLAAIVTAI